MSTSQEPRASHNVRSSYRRSSQIEKEHQEDQRKRELKQRNETLLKIARDACRREQLHRDERDLSRDPSFSKFQLPYIIKCRNRYNASKKLFEQRFQYEIEQLIAQQATGYEAARLNRHLCITTLWPPLHSRSEIIHTRRYFFNLSRKERSRLNLIMTTNII